MTGTSGAIQTTSKRGIWSWMFFDWAAQPFFTVVTTFIFGPYVVSRMIDDPVAGQTAWATGMAVAGIIIAILSPVLGSIADKTGPRKPWIAIFAVLKIISLTALWYAAPGSDIIWVLCLFILATIAAEFSIVFNDSMLPSLATSKEVGAVSNIAQGLGYSGGMIILIVVLLFMSSTGESGKTIIELDPIFGLDPAKGEAARATGPLSALWYLIFIIPMFLFTPDRGDRSTSFVGAVKSGVGELTMTFIEAKRRIGIFKFLIARMIYYDGVAALLGLGGVFAAGMFAWETTELGLFGIILNIAAIPSCFIAARLDTIFGSKKVVMTSIILLIFATIGVVSTGPDYIAFGAITFENIASDGPFSSPAEKAYIGFGLIIGIAFGPVQASSRSYLARSIEPHEAGRFFGLYAFVGRATSFLAPASVAAITAYYDSQRLGISVIILFFIVGGYLLAKTPYPADNKAK